MIRSFIFSALVLAASPAFAQTTSPSQTALQLDSVINQWAQALELQQQTIKTAQETINELQREVDSLKAAAASKPNPAPITPKPAAEPTK